MNIRKIPFTFFFLTSVIISPAQNFHNLNFEQTCDTSKTGLCYWDLSWGSKGAVKQDVVNGIRCLLLQGNKTNSVGWTEQTSIIPAFKSIKIITIIANISSENIEGKGAGFNINIYDKDENLIATKDMGGFYSIEWIRGTTSWKKYLISLVCPIDAAKIKIGAILYGKGKAWFKNYKVVFASTEGRKVSVLAKKYIAAACDTIRLNSLVRDSINISSLKETALRIAGPAKKYSDCYLAVSYLLESLRPYGDHHSFFMKADEVMNWKNGGSAVSKIELPSYKVIENCGYILVPPFHGGNQNTILAYADSLQLALKKLDNMGVKGWVIDLRLNTGGNQEPMIAGLGPLFSGEMLGSLVDLNGKAHTWNYKNGKYYGNDFEGWNVSNPTILTSKLPIAVLTSGQTGSSGEVVTISFIGNDKTKSFGQPTWGLTTGNGSFDLADGAKMFLASTIMADRNGKQYTSSIVPDVQFDNMIVDNVDVVLMKAIEWVKSQ
ncbi:MAG: S41 family peptidase [Chitinophagales bacterium]